MDLRCRVEEDYFGGARQYHTFFSHCSAGFQWRSSIYSTYDQISKDLGNPAAHGGADTQSLQALGTGKIVDFSCRLVFFVVRALRVVLFFAVWAGACCFFAVWPGAQAPPKQQKHDPAQTAKILNTPPPLPSVLSFAVWAGGRLYFCCCLGGGRVYSFFFCCLCWGRRGAGGGACFFAVRAGACLLVFAVWARGACLFFCCLGGAAKSLLLFGRGTGVHSLIGLPGSTSSDPTTKKTKQQKQNTGSL